MKRTLSANLIVTAMVSIIAVSAFSGNLTAQQKKPNIVVIFGDDIGMWNVGIYTHGMMGRTPNIDSIGRQGILFTDHYAQPSCTAGRAAFIMGQMPIRTGMTTIGIPGSTRGIQKSDPTLAEALKSVGYATGQFGKNHLGDRNEFLPTVHGFDEWFGNLYHLNAEEEPEELDYPGHKNPAYKEKFGPRGALHTWATDTADPTTDPKFGRVGKQRIQDTGPLTRERMVTFDREVTDVTIAERKPLAKDSPGAPRRTLSRARWSSLHRITQSNSTTTFSGGVMSPAQTDVIRSAPAAISRGRAIIQSSISPMLMPKRTQSGPVNACPPKPSGNLPHAAD